MKRYLNYLLIISLTLFVCQCDNGIEEVPTSNHAKFEYSPSYGVEFVDQHEAVEAYEKLMRGLVGSEINTRSLNSDYPDYYGGCYIDENNQLVVYTIGDSVQGRSSILGMTGDGVITKRGKYSFKTLKGIMDVIADFSTNEANRIIADNIGTVSLMDIQNNIVVQLKDCSEEKISEFKTKVIDSPAIIFEKQKDPLNLYSTIYPGATINYDRPFSLGYRVIRNGEEGYITAAHGVSLGQFIKIGVSGREQFAQCTDWQWGGTLDAAFCSSTYSATYSNTIAYTSLPLSNSYGVIVAGGGVYKSGYATGNTYGNIISTYTQTTIDGKTVTDLASSSFNSTHGDSGGIVYTNLYGYEGNPVGIIHGGVGTTTYFVKALNIDYQFNCRMNN